VNRRPAPANRQTRMTPRSRCAPAQHSRSADSYGGGPPRIRPQLRRRRPYYVRAHSQPGMGHWGVCATPSDRARQAQIPSSHGSGLFGGAPVGNALGHYNRQAPPSLHGNQFLKTCQTIFSEHAHMTGRPMATPWRYRSRKQGLRVTHSPHFSKPLRVPWIGHISHS
jgi:hypothetical protein